MVSKGYAPNNPTIDQFYGSFDVGKPEGGWTADDSLTFALYKTVKDTAPGNETKSENYQITPANVGQYRPSDRVLNDYNFQSNLNSKITGAESALENLQSIHEAQIKKISDKESIIAANRIKLEGMQSDFDTLEESYTGVGGFFRTAFNVFPKGDLINDLTKSMDALRAENKKLHREVYGGSETTLKEYGMPTHMHGKSDRTDLWKIEDEIKDLNIKKKTWEKLTNKDMYVDGKFQEKPADPNGYVYGDK